MTATELRLVRGDDGCDLPPLMAWEIWLRGAGRSERTIRDGKYTMLRLARHAGRPLEALSQIDVSRFLGNADLAPRSRAAYFGSISNFFKWWGSHGGTDITAGLPYPRSPKGTPRPLSTVALNRLLASRMHRRTRVMVMLGALSGLRVHEIAKVRGEDLDLDAQTLRVIGKGGRNDSIPLHPTIIEAAAGMPRRGWWFPGNSRRPGEHVTAKSVSDSIGQAMRRADVPGTPHALRHWYGTNLVASGADLRTAQTLLRHNSLQTTAIYVGVADQRRVDAVHRLTLSTDLGSAGDA